MDKTKLVAEVAHLFELNGHRVDKSVKINHRELDIVAKELQGLFQKTLLIECADYVSPVGIDKIQEDERKLRSARESLKESAVLVHVARNGYTSEALGYAQDHGLTIISLEQLTRNLINFSPYVDAVKNDRQYPVITREYQPTTIQLEGANRKKYPSLDFLQTWLATNGNILFILGDYGVGKSWLLKRLLFKLLEDFENFPNEKPLPLLVPLQRFTKSFDFKNLILKVFDDYGLAGVHFDAFRFLLNSGRVILLLDSFDEMAQSLSRTIVRDNLNALLDAGSGGARIIMTSRPNYFENRAERVLIIDRFDSSRIHKIDRILIEQQQVLRDDISRKLLDCQFTRLNDLTIEQRTKLFRIVLADKPKALDKLIALLKRFQNLEQLSQRAVIARLLTTVAETLSTDDAVKSVDGVPILPEDIDFINQAKIFEIVVFNLLKRDIGVGDLSAANRLRFLKAFALYLQGFGHDFFAGPEEVKEIVRSVFAATLRHTDTPEQDLENLYRTCRRHSGLTTEGQFYDTSGVIDLPISEDDIDSRIGFSHNSIREYLVALNISDAFTESDAVLWRSILSSSLTEEIFSFLYDIVQYEHGLLDRIHNAYSTSDDGQIVERTFWVILYFISRDKTHARLFGDPPILSALDLSGVRLSGLDLRSARITDCLAQEVDFTNSNLQDASFERTIVEMCKFDGANVKSTDFSQASLSSIFVYDEFDTRTTAVLEGDNAMQWLYSHGAIVAHPERLNPLIGKAWYEAAREVTRTLQKRHSGTHQQSSLAKGTDIRQRAFANSFVEFLIGAGILERVHRSSGRNEWVVRVNRDCMSEIEEFSSRGIISQRLQPFFLNK